MTSRTLARWAAAALAFAAVGAALADDAPAAFGRSIDPNTFIVGHPASPRWIVVHANHEHPAVAQARLAHQAPIDPNTFIVQPPASVRWLVGVDAPVAVAVAVAPPTAANH